MIFFITLFRYFTIVLFFTLHFSFSQGMQTRERAHCARSVFPFIKKKKKKIPKQVDAAHAPLKRVGRSVTNPESPDPRRRMEGENGTPQREQNGNHAEKKH